MNKTEYQSAVEYFARMGRLPKALSLEVIQRINRDMDAFMRDLRKAGFTGELQT